MTSSSSSSNDSLADEWISFEDFCQGVDSFLAPKSPTSGGEEDMLPQGKGSNFKLGHVVEVPYLDSSCSSQNHNVFQTKIFVKNWLALTLENRDLKHKLPIFEVNVSIL